MDNIYNNHYIRTDSQNRITHGWSDGPNPDHDTTGAICITDRGGYQFRLTHGGEENPALINQDGVHLYKYVNGEVTETTPEERAAELAEITAAQPPSPPDLESRVAAVEDNVQAISQAIGRGLSQ